MEERGKEQKYIIFSATSVNVNNRSGDMPERAAQRFATRLRSWKTVVLVGRSLSLVIRRKLLK